ncbi:ATP-binding protein [Streptomyces sp. R41]|uniref:ATP-binding protein n=1 Tax=Streptomyces sp. R41 TaxID=3238632 RepID=A0AB39RZJ3_9ACTN
MAAEFAVSAVRHGRVSGRDFHLALACDAMTVRIEVTDTRTEGIPVVTTPTDLRDTGRGLLLVEYLADRWDWHPRQGGPAIRSGRTTSCRREADRPPPPLACRLPPRPCM